MNEEECFAYIRTGLVRLGEI